MQVCVGERTSALINQEGHIYTWGLSNDVGQLGIREENGQSLPVLVSQLAERVATQVECGLDFCLALGQDCMRTTTPIEVQSISSAKEDLEEQVQNEENYIESDSRDSKSPGTVRPEQLLSELNSEPSMSAKKPSHHLHETFAKQDSIDGDSRS